MTLIVEDGSGLADAESFLSVEDADRYHGIRGSRAWAEALGDREAALCRASDLLSITFSWKGTRLKGRGQALAWPRFGASDASGIAIPAGSIPIEVRNATAELALRELLTPGSLSPDPLSTTASNRIVRKRIGDIEIEYANASSSSSKTQSAVQTIAQLIVAGLLEVSAKSQLFGTANRI